jgi:DNA-binding NarL/FixJ family response regulator
MGFKKILIIEDEFIIAEDIRTSLEVNGHSVISICGNGEDALKVACDLKPDILLADVVLEGKMNGIETAAKILDSLHIPVIYITAHSDLTTLEKAAKTLPYGYLLKPFGDRELIAALELAFHKQNIEIAIQKNQQNYKEILAHVPELLKVTQKDGEIIFISNSLKELLGLNLDEAPNNIDWLSFVHPQDYDKIFSSELNPNHTSEPVICEYRIHKNSNEWLKIEEKIFSFQTESNKILYYSIFSTI